MTSAYPALVLNADFTPLRVYPLPFWHERRTLRNIAKGKVVVVERYDALLHSAHESFQPASVVALREFMRPRDRVPFTRLNLFLRDDFRCQYCGERHTPGNLTFDHVIPRANGGGTNWENIVAACVPCNTRKGCRTDIKPMKAPHRPTGEEMLRKEPPPHFGRITLNKGQRDALSWGNAGYWSAVLDTD